LPPELIRAVRAQLQEGERLAWAGGPEPAAFERKSSRRVRWDAMVILGGGYATLAACVVAFRTEQWWWLFVPLFIVTLGGFGYFAASRIKARARRKIEGTVYGLSTRRALIVETYPELRVRAIAIESITDVILSDPRGDFADLGFGENHADFVFRGLPEAERTRSQLLSVVRDPQATDQQIAAAEAYSMAMHQMRAKVTSRPS
jgi:hypothetical protein